MSYRSKRKRRNPEVHVGLDEETLELRKEAFHRLMYRVRNDGIIPREAIREMYNAEPAWQHETLSQVTRNIMGPKDYSLDMAERDVLIGIGYGGKKGSSSLRGIWKHRRAYLNNLESRAVAIAHQAQEAWDDDEDEDAEPTAIEEISSPLPAAPEIEEIPAEIEEPVRVSPHAYNIWVWQSGKNYFVPHTMDGHVGSDDLTEAEELQAEALAEDFIAILLPRKINTRNFNLWELDDEGVWLPTIFKRTKNNVSAIHLGHSQREKAEVMADRWRSQTGRQVQILEADDDSLPVFRYQPSDGESWS